MASTTTERESLQTSPTLLNRLRDMRDHVGWQHFHELYRPLLLAVARRAGLREEDAFDVVQETIVEVAAALPTFHYDRAKGRFKGWLLTIVRRRIANHWRSTMTTRVHERFDLVLAAHEQHSETAQVERAI